MVSLINLSSKKFNYDLVIEEYIKNVKWMRDNLDYTPGTGIKTTNLTNPYSQTKKDLIKDWNLKYDWFINSKNKEPYRIHKVAISRALWKLGIKDVVWTIEHLNNGFDDLECFIFIANSKEQLEPVVSRKWKE